MRTHYQDRWQRGRLLQAGERECDSRWQAIRKILAEYSRPFTLLDIGADLGYFCLRAVEEFDCVAVAIDSGTQLAESFRANAAPGTIALQRRITVDELLRLGTCEHFDVVLALNILHHYRLPRPAVRAVFGLGDRVIVETPPPDDRGACGQNVVAALYSLLQHRGPARTIAATPSHTTAQLHRPMFLYETPRSRIESAYFDVPTGIPFGGVEILSNLSDKLVSFPRKGGRSNIRSWVPGINVQTYRCLGGVWPIPATVADMIRRTPLPTERHGDIQPWNFILAGDGVTLIDHGDDRMAIEDGPGREASAALVAAGGGA